MTKTSDVAVILTHKSLTDDPSQNCGSQGTDQIRREWENLNLLAVLDVEFELVNREKSPVCVSALLSCTGTQVYASREGRLQSIVILLLVFRAEFSLFCRSLSRFIFSILSL